MASKTWAAIERAVARMVGGERSWDSRDHIDVLEHETGYAIEVKNRKAITLAQIEGWLEHNAPKATGRGYKSALVVKRRAGTGHRTPFIAAFLLTEPVDDIEQGD